MQYYKLMDIQKSFYCAPQRLTVRVATGASTRTIATVPRRGNTLKLT
ncbi:hypothetical protein [Nostoc sp. NZL]|nr:hypothetical protein [Nostoc sp. NZL]